MSNSNGLAEKEKSPIMEQFLQMKLTLLALFTDKVSRFVFVCVSLKTREAVGEPLAGPLATVGVALKVDVAICRAMI